MSIHLISIQWLKNISSLKIEAVHIWYAVIWSRMYHLPWYLHFTAENGHFSMYPRIRADQVFGVCVESSARMCARYIWYAPLSLHTATLFCGDVNNYRFPTSSISGHAQFSNIYFPSWITTLNQILQMSIQSYIKTTIMWCNKQRSLCFTAVLYYIRKTESPRYVFAV